MCPYRVEITQGNTLDHTFAVRARLHCLIGRGSLHYIPYDVFAYLFGVAVRRDCRLARRLLRHGKLVRLAIDSGGRREEHIASSVRLCCLKDIQERVQIVLVIFYRFSD